MDAINLLNADLTDIIFEGRNKAYGAYVLRKTYSRRLYVAMAITASAIALCLLGYVLKDKNNISTEWAPSDGLTLVDFKPREAEIPKTVPLAPQNTLPPKVKMIQFTPYVIVKEEAFTEDDKAPEMERLENVVLGALYSDGENLADGRITPPPESVGTGLTVAPKSVSPAADTVFSKVENPAEFPGGPEAWRRYLERSLKYPDIAIENGTDGVVSVQFIVDREGNISEVTALNNPGDGLAEEAVRIIKKGPKWRPAEQNGRKVIYRHTQRITFRTQ